MKNVFYSYSSNIKTLPKGVGIIVVLLLLVLIPLIIALALGVGIIAGTTKLISNLLPFRKKRTTTTQSIDTEDVDYVIVESAEEKNFLSRKN